ncbi:hypothetical protein PR003_g27003 [Phytophthora rubi]|uniref:Uncharacterized protein n=1 Tax=Phytophthora rubi TaxID=129364 RepID=A0A6A3I5K8_9STRA|nr:hypothetical protein PR001_g25474 [Phytophthora rubi]KAE8976629.1 hypothetical protein PR002_g25263 [Phytophthora rubi]KAE9283894.1 hypothetical protein PR003_g27003 [Phytophthora rubi]
MAERVAAESPMSNVQKLKLQLFHRLQRRHRDAWKRYWGSFQLYLAAKLSLEEFHVLAEELLGPDKHLHNKFVVALLSTAYLDAAELRSSPQPPSAPEIHDHNGEGGGQAAVEAGQSPTWSNDPLLQIIKEEGARHDSEQRSRVKQEPHGRKRPHSSVEAADNNAEGAAVNKLVHLDRDTSRAHEHPDHLSAQLLMGLGKHATSISPSSIAITAKSAPSGSRTFQSSVSSDGRRE